MAGGFHCRAYRGESRQSNQTIGPQLFAFLKRSNRGECSGAKMSIDTFRIKPEAFQFLLQVLYGRT